MGGAPPRASESQVLAAESRPEVACYVFQCGCPSPCGVCSCLCPVLASVCCYPARACQPFPSVSSATHPAKMARTKASAKKSAGGKSPKAKASKKTTKTARKAGKGGKRKFKPGTVALREIRKIQKGRGGHILTPLRSGTLH